MNMIKLDNVVMSMATDLYNRHVEHYMASSTAVGDFPNFMHFIILRGLATYKHELDAADAESEKQRKQYERGKNKKPPKEL